MSTDESNGGFLSKVMKFVRHPTTSWADLETGTADRESEYSKAELKEMIERKRRNDFVRKREFDSLRKIRSRESSGEESPEVRPSFFQSSHPSRSDDRAMTLKKIDEIEAQMSMQWWKTKSSHSLTTGSGTSTGAHTAGGTPLSREKEAADSQEKMRIQPYIETEVSPHEASAPQAVPLPSAAQSVATPIALCKSGAPPIERERMAPTPAKPSPSSVRTGLMVSTARGFLNSVPSMLSASHFYVLDMQEVAQDPEVEEASIRFANGDDAGAEQCLLEALGDEGRRAHSQQHWLALLDLYRATGQLALFESKAVDFVNRFNRSAPQWVDMPEIASSFSGQKFRPSSAPNRAVWVCEPLVDAHAVGTLQSVLLRTSQPWVLDWSPVESIDVKAARALLGIFTLWGDQDVELRFCGTRALCDLLKKLTPSGRRDVEQIWWELRMAALRVMDRADEFEIIALDFCVTYELSPPGWEQPLCHFQSVSNDDSGETSPSVSGATVLEQAPSTYPSDTGIEEQASDLNNLGLVELSGAIRGDSQDTLTALEQRLKDSGGWIISCRHLMRVDFSAAGSLLNWVSGHHAEGRTVQFVDVNRLVAAFFHVIGITEYAKVVLRND